MVTSMCAMGMCPMGTRELCDPNNPMCPPGDTCRPLGGGMYGTCRRALDAGMGGEGGMPMDAGGGG
jgi:hypothetical protein